MAVAVQLFDVPVMVYTILLFGVEVTTEPDEELKLVAGLQINEFAPDAFN